MATELDRRRAAQAKADAVVAAVQEQVDGVLLLRVAVTDVVAYERLGTCFVNYQADTELDRRRAAQAKADEVITAVAEAPEGGQLLRVLVTDVATERRLGMCFVNYQADSSPYLRLVTSSWNGV